MTFEEIVQAVDDFVWGIPLIVLILGVGIYLTVRLVFLPVRKLPRAFKYMFEKEEGEGEVSSFGALCTALSATIGTGNIVGVATAIAAGGPGALLWMWLAAFFGMGTKYAEGLLAVKYRKVYPDGHTLGGPFYYIENGLGRRWKFLAVIFAVLGMCVGLFGIGTFSQVNSITGAVGGLFENAPTLTLFGQEYNWAVIIAGIVLTAVVALVLLGGIKRIAKVSEMVVPFMVIVYVLVSLIILFANVTAIPAAFAQIFVGAFNPRAVAGGVAGSMLVAMQSGIARGIFSNEAGLGSAPIAAAAARTKEPVRQGTRFHDGYLPRYPRRLHDDGSDHRHHGRVARRRAGGRFHYNVGVCAGPARHTCRRRADHSDGLPHLLRFYDYFGLEFLRRALSRICRGQEKICHLCLSDFIYCRHFYRAVHDRAGGLEHCGHIQRTDGDPQPHRADLAVGRGVPRNEELFPPLSDDEERRPGKLHRRGGGGRRAAAGRGTAPERA